MAVGVADFNAGRTLQNLYLDPMASATTSTRLMLQLVAPGRN
jgi:hypothetical protein